MTQSATGHLVVSGEAELESGFSVTVNRTFKDASLIGDTELVPAQPGKKIRLLAFAVQAGVAVSVRLKSAGNNLSASFALGANLPFILPHNPHGWFETNVGEALVLNQSLAVSSGVQVVWIAV